MKIEILYGKEEIEVKKSGEFVSIVIGDLDLGFEKTKDAEYLLEDLERVLLPEEKHRYALENRIEELQEKIDELEEWIKTPEADKRFYHHYDI